ncbi:sporulation YhaL family protein [Anaerobacillus isosaccharinicus]|uniref:Sporulation YhaL family protein n=1 Tax=Anaerobacillus isosaccharinicus TaxID=1532552 RepID=A0A7S7RBY1_9BACI|nr:sporulation YhaL family protein [Anaerobacillus isosaccharinicus]MBA5585307.1 sporulation YhaL family protein [Anaerobacillus isosaccharinicus]QOY36366.1 sporulation YhaL family protein [Anaerobacillus isosaccharinicus]
MNPVKFVGALIGGFLILFIVRLLLLVTPIAAKVQASPWWIYFIVGGIIVSGYLSFKYTKEDREVEQRWIEQEGETFMEPIRKRRENKQLMNE